MSLKDDLIAAKALIDTPEKWCKGIEGPGLDAVAAAGTIANGSDESTWAIFDALADAMPSGRGLLVFQYNDHPDTTHADVMVLFDRAIEAA